MDFIDFIETTFNTAFTVHVFQGKVKLDLFLRSPKPSVSKLRAPINMFPWVPKGAVRVIGKINYL